MHAVGEVCDISQPSKIRLRVLQRAAVLKRFANVLAVDVIPGRLAVLLIEIRRTGRRFMRNGNDGQAVVFTVIVRVLPKTMQLSLGVVVLLSVYEGDGIEDKVIVEMLLVQMCGDDDLKAIAPHGLCGHYADLVTELRGDLAGLKALVAVPCDKTVCLAKLLFGQNHLPHGGLSGAVDGSDILTVCRRLGALGIPGGVPEILQIRDGTGLVRVFSIVDHVLNATGDVPKLSRRHQGTSSSSVYASCSSTMPRSKRCAASLNCGERFAARSSIS